MVANLFPLRAVSVYEEPNGSFGVDHSGTPGDFLPMPAQAGDLAWSKDRTLLDPATLQQYKHGRPTKVHGPKGTTLNMTVPFGITGTLGDATTATKTKADSALLRQLAITMGGERSGTMGSLVATATSSSVFTVTGTEGSRFVAGGGLGRVTTSGVMEIREIADVTGDVITLKQAFSEGTTIADPIYAAITFYLDDSLTHAQYLIEGADADDYNVLLGMQLQGLTITTPSREIPTLGFQMQGASWDNVGSGTLAGETYANYTPISFDAGEFLVQDEGTVTRNVVSIYEIAMTSALTYIAQSSIEGVETVLGYCQQHAPPVMAGTWGTYYEDETWMTKWQNRTLQHLALQVGRSSAGGWLITANGAQLGPVTSPQTAGDGFVGTVASFEAGLDNDTGALTSALLRSPFRFHIVG